MQKDCKIAEHIAATLGADLELGRSCQKWKKSIANVKVFKE